MKHSADRKHFNAFYVFTLLGIIPLLIASYSFYKEPLSYNLLVLMVSFGGAILFPALFWDDRKSNRSKF